MKLTFFRMMASLAGNVGHAARVSSSSPLHLLLVTVVALGGSRATGQAQCVATAIMPSSAVGMEQFGGSIAMTPDGARLLVGVPGADGGAGYARVYVPVANTWQLEGTLSAGDPNAGDALGSSVAIDGLYAIAGAPGDDAGGGDAGAAYVYARSGVNWGAPQKLVASDGSVFASFGTSVAISGDYLVVGAPFDSGAAFLAGAVYVFKRSGSLWSQVSKLSVPNAQGNEQFGASLAIDGTSMLVGAPGRDGPGGVATGAVFAYELVREVWIPIDTVIDSFGAAEDFLGSAVAMSGSRAVVGAPGGDAPASDAGVLLVLERSGFDWQIATALVTQEAPNGANFGRAVALWGDAVIAGGPAAAGGGEARLFRVTDRGWVETAPLSFASIMSGDELGCAVAVAENTIAIGARFAEGPRSTSTGGVFIIESAFAPDCNGDLAPDGCQPDCNGNAVPDLCDILEGVSLDCDGNLVPDECETPTCIPTITGITISGEAWTDPTKAGAMQPPTITLEGSALFAEAVLLRNLENEVIVEPFSAGATGNELSFVLPPFPPGSALGGTIPVTVHVITQDGAVEAPITLSVLRRTVGAAQDFPNLPQALNASKPGWAIAVKPGTYSNSSTLDFTGRSALTIGGDGASPNILMTSGGTDVIRLDGNDRSVRLQSLDLNGGNMGVVVTGGATPFIDRVNFIDNERGILVTGGSAPFVRGCTFSTDSTDGFEVDGNGAAVVDATATFVDCQFIGNEDARFGTLYLSATTDPVLVANTLFFGNKTMAGGAIYVADGGDVRLIGSQLLANEAKGLTGGQGGAVYIAAQSGRRAQLIELSGNVIADNLVDKAAQCEIGQSGGGGGIFVGQDAAPRIVDNRISGNRAAHGGAIAVCRGATPLIQRNLICGNVVYKFNNAGDQGAAIFLYDCEPRILNNVIWGNDDTVGPGDPDAVADQGGGIHGVDIKSPGTVYANNLIAENDSWGIYHSSALSEFFVDIVHNILWNNEKNNPDLCGNCNAECNQNCMLPLCGCSEQAAGNGWTVANLFGDPQTVLMPPLCGVYDTFLPGEGSPAVDAGLAFGQKLQDSVYDLYHPGLPVDIGLIARDGVVIESPGGAVAREIGSHAAIEVASPTPLSVILDASAFASIIDPGLSFTIDVNLPGLPATMATRFMVEQSGPPGSIVVELPWISAFGAHNRILLAVDADNDQVFDTITAYEGEVDQVEGTVRFEGVDGGLVHGRWLAGLIGAVPGGSTTCTGDLTRDGLVDGADLGSLLAAWGTAGPSGDLDRSGLVNGADLGLLLSAWGSCE